MKNISIFDVFSKAGFIGLVSTLIVPTTGYTFQPGTYSISGQHSLYGAYRGQMTVFTDQSVQRKVEITRSNQKLIQKWEGQLFNRQLDFQIRTSNVLTSVEKFKATAQDLKIKNLEIHYPQTKFSLPQDGEYTENYQVISNQEMPLFEKSTKKRQNTFGDSTTKLISLAQFIGINKVVEKYREQEFLSPWRNRPEFVNEESYDWMDLDDLTYYRSGMPSLVIRNQSINPLSIAEAQLRQNAFSYTLNDKARVLDEDTQKYNINELGILELATIDQQGNLLDRHPEGDSALWTGIYAYAQFLKWKVTNDPKAYAQFRKTLKGILHLIQISPDESRFARFIHLSPPDEPLPSGFIQGQGIYTNYKYNADSNNDMSKGILLGFLLAYEGLTNQDVELKQEFKAMIPRLFKIKALQSAGVNSSTVDAIAALYTKDQEHVQAYLHKVFNFTETLVDIFDVNVGFRIGAIEDPSGVHLSFLSSLIRYKAANLLRKEINFQEHSHQIEQAQSAAKKYMSEMTARMRVSKHGYLEILNVAFNVQDRQSTNLSEGLRRLIEYPAKKAQFSYSADMKLQPDWVMSPWPLRPWKALKAPFIVSNEKLQDDNLKQGVDSYPLFYGMAQFSTYVWKDKSNPTGFEVSASSQKFNADYLFVYWMGRSAGVISPKD